MNLTTEFLQLHFNAKDYQERLVLGCVEAKGRTRFFISVCSCVCVDTQKFILFICGFHWYFRQKGQCFEAGGWVCSLRTGGDSRMQLYY